METDAHGRISLVEKPDGLRGKIEYDEDGGVTLLEDLVNGEITRFAYHYDTHKEEYSTMIASPSGQVKELWFDSQGRTRRISLDGEVVTRIELEDEEGRTLLVTDACGRTTRKEYDEKWNLVRVEHPDGEESRYKYDAITAQQVSANERGSISEYTYRANGALERLVTAKGSDHEIAVR